MSKLDQIKALREAKASGKSSRGGVESQTRATELEEPTRALGRRGSVRLRHGFTADVAQRPAGVAPGPRETKKGRPRIGEVRDKPWIEAGMSRRTWYRRKAEAKK